VGTQKSEQLLFHRHRVIHK